MYVVVACPREPTSIPCLNLHFLLLSGFPADSSRSLSRYRNHAVVVEEYRIWTLLPIFLPVVAASGKYWLSPAKKTINWQYKNRYPYFIISCNIRNSPPNLLIFIPFILLFFFDNAPQIRKTNKII